MKKILLLVLLVMVIGVILFLSTKNRNDSVEIVESCSDILFYELNLDEQELYFYSKDENGQFFENHAQLKSWLEKNGKRLIFAMNGGMYKKDLSPQGLYIENAEMKSAIDEQKEGYGNFYLQPNGVFYLSEQNESFIETTENYTKEQNVKYATQSGPMLVINGEIHTEFDEHSQNLHIRNGVGILPNDNLLFAMSKEKVNFYRLAQFFQENQCKNALYLDGFVSRTYLPSKDWIQKDGRFGVIIAEVEK